MCGATSHKERDSVDSSTTGTPQGPVHHFTCPEFCNNSSDSSDDLSEEEESDYVRPPLPSPLPLTASEEREVEQSTRIGLVATHKCSSDILTEDDRREMEAIRRSLGMLPRKSVAGSEEWKNEGNVGTEEPKEEGNFGTEGPKEEGDNNSGQKRDFTSDLPEKERDNNWRLKRRSDVRSVSQSTECVKERRASTRAESYKQGLGKGVSGVRRLGEQGGCEGREKGHTVRGCGERRRLFEDCQQQQYQSKCYGCPHSHCCVCISHQNHHPPAVSCVRGGGLVCTVCCNQLWPTWPSRKDWVREQLTVPPLANRSHIPSEQRASGPHTQCGQQLPTNQPCSQTADWNTANVSLFSHSSECSLLTQQPHQLTGGRMQPPLQQGSYFQQYLQKMKKKRTSGVSPPHTHTLRCTSTHPPFTFTPSPGVPAPPPPPPPPQWVRAGSYSRHQRMTQSLNGQYTHRPLIPGAWFPNWPTPQIRPLIRPPMSPPRQLARGARPSYIPRNTYSHITRLHTWQRL